MTVRIEGFMEFARAVEMAKVHRELNAMEVLALKELTDVITNAVEAALKNTAYTEQARAIMSNAYDPASFASCVNDRLQSQLSKKSVGNLFELLEPKVPQMSGDPKVDLPDDALDFSRIGADKLHSMHRAIREQQREIGLVMDDIHIGVGRPVQVTAGSQMQLVSAIMGVVNIPFGFGDGFGHGPFGITYDSDHEGDRMRVDRDEWLSDILNASRKYGYGHNRSTIHSAMGFSYYSDNVGHLYNWMPEFTDSGVKWRGARTIKAQIVPQQQSRKDKLANSMRYKGAKITGKARGKNKPNK